MQRSGFLVLIHEVIEQQFADRVSEYYDKVSQRGLSDLVCLPDAEFEAGVLQMREDITRNEISGPILEPIDLFIFKKTDEPSN